MSIARLLVLLTVTLGLVGGQVFGGVQADSLDALYPVFVQGHWGLINAAGEEVLPPVYDKIANWPDKLIPGWTGSPAAGASIDIKTARPITAALIPVVKGSRAGWATRDGRLMAMGRYDETGEDYGGGRLWMRIGRKVGFADENGETVIAPQFEWVQFHGTPGSGFSRGFAFAKIEGRWGVIDLEGKWIAPPTWDEIDNSEGDELTRARLGDRWGVVDRTGQCPCDGIILWPRHRRENG